jgi:hypothetical protein
MRPDRPQETVNSIRHTQRIYPPPTISARSSRRRRSHSSSRRRSRSSRTCRPRACPSDTPICTGRCLRHRNRRSLSNRNIRLTTALLSLNTHDHVVLLSKLQASSFPSPEVVASIDGAAAVHLGADRPVLLEVRVVADYGRRIGALLLPDFVGCAVGGVGAKEVGGGVVGGVVFAHCEGRWLGQSCKDDWRKVKVDLLDSIT